MSDNLYQDWKELGWQKMQSSLNEEMPVKSNFSFIFQHSAWIAVGVILAFLFFRNYSLKEQIKENEQVLALVNSRLDLTEMNLRVQNDLNALSSAFENNTDISDRQGLFKKAQSVHSLKHKNQDNLASYFPQPIVKREVDLISQSTDFFDIHHPISEVENSENKVYDELFPRIVTTELNESANQDLNNAINLTKAEYREIPAKKSKGIYAFINTRSDVQMYGAMMGMFTGFDINSRWNVEAGLGYVWSKNDYAIQATQIDEVVLTNQITGATTIQRIEYPTRIVVDNLHYLQIPVSINYQVTQRLSLGTGIEGRFLINNYYSADEGRDYNLRVTPYTDQNTGKVGLPHDYDLRKYALGAVGRLEYRLNERYGIVARHYMGLINISGDKVYNARNEIRNSSFNAGLKMYF
jgi:hypothetical protein